MAATDAQPIPQKNAAFRIYFPILDADGDLVTGAAGLDSERSIDGETFEDCTNEATEIATSSGMYFLDLTAAEMNGDCIVVIVKTSTVGAKTTPMVLYPEETGDIEVNVTAYGGTAGAFTSGRPEVILGDVAHGGTAATFTFERFIGAATTLNEPCIKLTGNGTQPGMLSTGGATDAFGARFVGGGTNGSGMQITGDGTGAGLQIVAASSGDALDCTSLSGNDISAFNIQDIMDSVGEENEAAAAGDPSTTESLMQYVKQLVNVLVGTTGVTTFPAEAAPGNGVSLAEVIRAMHTDVTGLNGDAMRGTDSAALASVVGALADAAAAGDPTASDTIVAYVKQLVNVLVGTAGVATWAAEQAPANAVSIHEVLRAIHADVTGLNGDAMRGTDSAALASVVGALADAAAAGDPTASDTIMQYVKQLVNVLVGTAGIGTWPAAAAPANAVSIAEALRAVYDDTNEIGTAGAGLTDLGGMSTAMKAEVEVEVNDAIDTAIAELGVAAPTATPTIRTGLMALYMMARNKLVVQTSGTDALEVHNDAGTKIFSKLLTDDGSDYTEAEAS